MAEFLKGMALIALLAFCGTVIAGALTLQPVDGSLPADVPTARVQNHVIVLPDDCTEILSASKTSHGIFVTFEGKGYGSMVQYEYEKGAWKATHRYDFARRK